MACFLALNSKREKLSMGNIKKQGSFVTTFFLNGLSRNCSNAVAVAMAIV